MRDSRNGNSGMHASQQAPLRSKSRSASRSASRDPSRGYKEDLLNQFNSDLSHQNKSNVKVEVRYQHTINNLANTYHSNRELLMGAEVVTMWAVLHHTQRALLDSYKVWLRHTRLKMAMSTPLATVDFRVIKHWRYMTGWKNSRDRVVMKVEDRMMRAVQYAESKLVHAQSRIVELMAQLQEAGNNAALENKVDDLDRELRIARKEIINLKDEIALLQSELAACKKNCLKNDQLLRDAELRASKAEVEKSAACKEADREKRRAGDLHNEVIDLRAQLKAMQANDRALEELRAKLRDESAARSRAETSESRAVKEEEVQRTRGNDLQRELNELRNRLKNAEANAAELDDLRAQLRDERNKSSRLEKKCDEIKFDLEAEIEKLRRQLKEAGATGKECENLRKALRECQTARKRAESDASHSEKECERLKKELEALRNKLQDAESRLRDALATGKDAADLRRQLKEAQTACSRAQDDCAHAERESTRMRKELEHKSDEIEDLKRQLADLRKQLKDVEDRLAKNSKESDELRELRAKLRAEIEIKLRFEKDVKRSEKETDIQRKRADDLQRELDELRRRIKDLERDLVDAKKGGGDVAALQGELSDLRRKLAAAEKARDQAVHDHRDCGRMNGDLERLRKQLSDLQMELDRKIQTKDGTIGDQKSEIRDLLKEIEQLKAMLRKLEDELRAAGAATAKSAADDDAAYQKKLSGVLARWLKMNMSRSLNKWRDCSAVTRRTKMALKRIAYRWRGDKMYKAFSKLRDYAEAVRIKELEFQAYYTRTLTPTSKDSKKKKASLDDRPARR